MAASKLQLSAEPVGLVACNAPDYYRKFCDIIASGAIVVPLREAEDRFRRDACGIARVVTPDPGFGWIDGAQALPPGPEIAQIAFTSGTQGEPKGVILTRDNLADTAGRLAAIQGLDAGVREYVGVPIHHSFGLGRCRAVAAAGGRAYVPERGFDPREIRAMLEAGEINAVSAVPSLWRVALRNRDILAPVGDRVRWIEIGSQPMSLEDKRAMLALFPRARIVQHYGLTEASRSTFLDLCEAAAAGDAALDTVGAPNGAAEAAVDDAGRIRIRGPHVARELIVGGARVPNIDAEGWFVTRDLGEIEGGRLRFLGRADDMLNLSGVKVSSDLLEARIARALGAEGEISVVRIPDADRGDGVLVAVRQSCPASDARVAEAATAALAEQGIAAASAVRVGRFAEFPATDAGKIRRFALAEDWLTREAAAPAPASADPAGPRGLLARLGARLAPRRGTADVATAFARCFPGRAIQPTDSFVSLGGDSLTFVEASIALADALGELPDDWPELSVAELQARRRRSGRLRPIDTTIFLRFIGIIAIVTFHFAGLAEVGGATFLLLVAAGYNFSRFQVENVLAADRPGSMLVSAFRIALPTWVVVALIQLRHWTLIPMYLLLVSNFYPAAGQVVDYWFVEVLVQLLLALAAVFALPAARRAARRRPYGFACAALALGVALALAGPWVWDTRAIYDRSPHLVFWMFALGWVLHRAPSRPAEFASLAVALVLPFVIWGGARDWPAWIENGPWWISFGCVLLVLLKTTPLPAPIDRFAYLIGGASLFIYISHYPVKGIWDRISPVQSAALDIGVALAAGVAFWLSWEAGMRWVAALWKRAFPPRAAEAGALPGPWASRPGGVDVRPPEPAIGLPGTGLPGNVAPRSAAPSAASGRAS